VLTLLGLVPLTLVTWFVKRKDTVLQ